MKDEKSEQKKDEKLIQDIWNTPYDTDGDSYSFKIKSGRRSAILNIPGPEQEPEPFNQDLVYGDEQNDEVGKSLVIIMNPNGHSRVTTLGNYENYRSSLAGRHVFIDYTKTLEIINNGGEVDDVLVDTGHDIKELLGNVISYQDAITGEDLTNIVVKVIDKEQPPVEVDQNALIFSARDIQLLKVNPPLYKKTKVDKEQEKLNLSQLQIEERFLFLSIYYPEQIPEFFTIVSKEPWSDLMRNYLVILADLISTEMNNNDEIDDLDKLQAIAHKKSGYREDLDTVKEMAKEYEDYFKYCLIKDNNLLLERDKAITLTELANVLKDLNMVKKVSGKNLRADKIEIKKQYISEPIKDKPYLMSDYSDITKWNSGDGTLYINIFTKVDMDLYEFTDNISTELKNRMAILHEITNPESKKTKIIFNYIVVDKNNLCYVFEVKSSTIKKWKSKLSQLLDRAYWHVYKNRYDLPYEFVNEGVTI